MTGRRNRCLLCKLLAATLTAVVAGMLVPTASNAHALSSYREERKHIARRAKSQIGARYRYGGSSPRGFDCSGFTRWVYRKHGARLPHDSMRQFRLAGRGPHRRIWKRRNLRVGDLVFHKTSRGERVGHVGIYIGRHRFISSTSSRGVRVNSIYDRYYWGRRWVAATRLHATRNQ